MIKRLWNSLKFFNCRDTESELKQQVIQLLSQIQELKAISHYQSFDLERKIDDIQNKLEMRNCAIEILEKENGLLKGKMADCKAQIEEKDE